MAPASIVDQGGYDLLEIKTGQRWIFQGGGPIIAWFEHLAGNILSALEQK